MTKNTDRPDPGKRREIAEKPRKKGASAAAVGVHLSITKQYVGQLTDQGIFQRGPDGKYDLDATRLAYIQFLRGEKSRGTKAAQANAFRDARAREIEQRIAKEDGRLIPIDDVAAGVGEIMGALRAELGGLAAASTRDLGLRETIDGLLNGAIDRTRQRFEAMEGGIRAGRGVVLEGEEADAG